MDSPSILCLSTQSLVLTKRRINALAAMRLIFEPFPSDPIGKREFYLASCFDKDATSALRIAALSYLGECGITADSKIHSSGNRQE